MTKQEAITETKQGIINYHASVNETFLAPYFGYPVKWIKHKNGKVDIEIYGTAVMENVGGRYISEYNGWPYTVKKLIDFK